MLSWRPGGKIVRLPLTWVIRIISCPWEPYPFQNPGPPASHFQLALCLAVLCHHQRVDNNTLSAACVVDFVLLDHLEKKRLKIGGRRRVFCIYMYYFTKTLRLCFLIIGVVGIVWLIKGILGTLKWASLWVCVCACVCLPCECYDGNILWKMWEEVPTRWRQSPAPSELPCFMCAQVVPSKMTILWESFFFSFSFFCCSRCCCWCFNVVYSFRFNIFLMLLLILF